MKKTYWITGASSGIGEALAKTLNKEGHEVILSARNKEKLSLVAKSCPHPEKVKIVSFDLSAVKDFSGIIDEVYGSFGKLDTVILNAGISQRSLVKDTKENVYQDLMNVNFFSNVSLTQALLPKFLEKNHGQFVVITSLVGKFGTPLRSGYAASKHALHGFFDSLRAEMMMEDKNIHVTLICPGFVNTDISVNALGGEGKATGVRDTSNAAGLSPEAFAEKAVAVIHSKKYEAYIGGKEIVGVYLKRFVPNYFAKMISKAKVR